MTDRRSLIALGIAALVLVALVGALEAWGGSGKSSGDHSGNVKVACRDWVKDRLKAPASADFSAETVSRDGSSYVVTGSVDSENSFGAPIRNTYRCEATNDGDGASHLVSISGLEN